MPKLTLAYYVSPKLLDGLCCVSWSYYWSGIIRFRYEPNYQLRFIAPSALIQASSYIRMSDFIDPEFSWKFVNKIMLMIV